MNKTHIEYAKQLVKEIRADIKTKIPHILPDITYEIIRVQKPNHQDINIRFDSLKLKTLKEIKSTNKQLETLYSKYEINEGSQTGTIFIKIHSCLKGDFLKEIGRFTLEDHLQELPYTVIVTPSPYKID